jgi:hypothetical protein
MSYTQPVIPQGSLQQLTKGTASEEQQQHWHQDCLHAAYKLLCFVSWASRQRKQFLRAKFAYV